MTEAAEMPQTRLGQPPVEADCIVDLLLFSLGAEVLLHPGDFSATMETIGRPFLASHNGGRPHFGAITSR